jgi:hypothetical protein
MALSETRKDLLKALTQVQNHPAFRNVDILTITGCGMTDDEVRAHLEANITHIANFNFEQAQQPARKSRRAA